MNTKHDRKRIKETETQVRLMAQHKRKPPLKSSDSKPRSLDQYTTTRRRDVTNVSMDLKIAIDLIPVIPSGTEGSFE